MPDRQEALYARGRTAKPTLDGVPGHTEPEPEGDIEGVPRIDHMLSRAREGLDRVHPQDLDSELAAGALLVDLRPIDQRQAHGKLPGALVIGRSVLEWRLDPSSPHRIPQADAERRVILVCHEGYSSSLAAWSLQQLGVRGATDLVGGFVRWKHGGELGS